MSQSGLVTTPASGRVLGLDLGTRRIGVAITDSSRTMALPRTTIVRSRDREQAHRELLRLVAEDEVTLVVIGLPVSLDGHEGAAAISARSEGAELAGKLESMGVGVEWFDERLSTVTAHQVLAEGGLDSRRRRGVVDQAAASVILEAWIERQRGKR